MTQARNVIRLRASSGNRAGPLCILQGDKTMTVQANTNLDVEAAFTHKGAQAAVFRPRFG